MPRRPDAAATAALALYAGQRRSDRGHVRGRWWTAPFAAVEAELPRGGRVLEIGCGHGLFVAYAALRDPARTVHGVDIDADKIAVGQAALAPLRGRASVELGRSGVVPAGPWEAIVILDVLYLLAASAQRALLEACARELAPGGVLLVKEMGTEPAWKFRWNTIQETLAVKVLRITAGQDFDFVPPAGLEEWLGASGLVADRRRLDAGYLHPHVLIRGRKPTREDQTRP